MAQTPQDKAQDTEDNTATISVKTRFFKAAEGYLNDDRFSDFTIICEGKHFKVHRCFISAHSKWFERCCAGMFEEARKQEVELKGDRIEAVERMIRFFYTWDYDDSIGPVDALPSVSDPQSVLPILMNAYVFALADKYDIPDLKTLALEKFKKASVQLHCQFPLEWDLLRLTYTIFKHVPLPNSEDCLRRIVISVWTTEGDVMSELPYKDSVHKLFMDIPEFGFRMASHFLWNTSCEKIIDCCKDCGGTSEYGDMDEVVTGGFKRCACLISEGPQDLHVAKTYKIEPYW